jgi:hypothetical protein
MVGDLAGRIVGNQQVVVILNVKQPSVTNPIDHPDGSTVIAAIVD